MIHAEGTLRHFTNWDCPHCLFPHPFLSFFFQKKGGGKVTKMILKRQFCGTNTPLRPRSISWTVGSVVMSGERGHATLAISSSSNLTVVLRMCWCGQWSGYTEHPSLSSLWCISQLSGTRRPGLGRTDTGDGVRHPPRGQTCFGAGLF